MIGRLVSSLAGKVIARNVSGVQSGRVGAVAGFAMPSILPVMRRRLGPVAMLGLALGGVVGKRIIERRRIAREQAEQTTDTPPRADS